MLLVQERQRQWNGLVAFSWGHDTRSSPHQHGQHGGFPQQCQGMFLLCLLLSCQEPSDAFSPHFPGYVLADPLQSIFCILSVSYHRLSQSPARPAKRSASLLTTVSLWNSSWAAGGVEGRSKQDGRASSPPFPLEALTPGQCVPQKLCGLPRPFSLLVHLCFLCHNPQGVPVRAQKADILSRRARWSKANLLD